jgi:hypothetical protein
MLRSDKGFIQEMNEINPFLRFNRATTSMREPLAKSPLGRGEKNAIKVLILKGSKNTLNQ